MAGSGETSRAPGDGRPAVATGQLLVVPLIAIALIELLSYRLAAPVLRPGGDDDPGIGLEILENVGLFGFYMSSILAGAVLVLLVWHQRIALLTAAGIMLAGLALASQLISPASPWLELGLQLAYAAVLVISVYLAVRRPGDIGTRVGIALLSIPLLIHVWTPLALRWYGPEALFDGLPETAISAGQWTLIAVASASPYVFAPRPFVRSITRPAPLVAAIFIGVTSAILIRKHFEVGAVLASHGLGLHIGVSAPEHEIALGLLALATLTWTMVSCLSAASPARRRIGMGLALLVIAGYSFEWPMQYTLGAVAMVLISQAAGVVGREEKQRGTAIALSSPPILPETWALFSSSMERDLAAHLDTAVKTTHHHNGSIQRTMLQWTTADQEWRITIEQHGNTIVAMNIVGGASVDTAPEATVYRRPQNLASTHPPPPQSRAPEISCGDAELDSHFVVRAPPAIAGALATEASKRALARNIDGWLAIWPGKRIEYTVYPGRGAPIDRPLPVTELAFRGDAAAMTSDALIELVDVLAELSKTAAQTSDSQTNEEGSGGEAEHRSRDQP